MRAQALSAVGNNPDVLLTLVRVLLIFRDTKIELSSGWARIEILVADEKYHPLAFVIPPCHWPWKIVLWMCAVGNPDENCHGTCVRMQYLKEKLLIAHRWSTNGDNDKVPNGLPDP